MTGFPYSATQFPQVNKLFYSQLAVTFTVKPTVG